MLLRQSRKFRGLSNLLVLNRDTFFLYVCTVLLATTGCGGTSAGPSGNVHGKVTFAGKPVTSGARVAFVSTGGSGATGAVGDDGTYQLATPTGQAIPTGTYKILITPPAGQTPTMEEAMKASMQDGEGNSPPPADPTIPDEYRSITSTPLTFDVKEGDNEYNIELKAD